MVPVYITIWWITDLLGVSLVNGVFVERVWS